MPKISHRGEIMPASPIRKLVPYAEKAKQRGINIYHLKYWTTRYHYTKNSY
jgi:aspartate aminotransferase